MYLSHYQLKVKPFQISPDPEFLWLGESHKQALSIFKDGLNHNRGLIFLIGDVGTGKTTLINRLVESLDEDVLVASVQYPGFDILDFYNFLAVNFKMGRKFTSKGGFLIRFIHFLHEEYACNKKVLLIVDEAQGLSYEILDEIRLLSNLERMKTKLLNIFMVGQSEMDDILAQPNHKELTQSIAAKCYLGPIKEDEVKDYIDYRLQVAGAEHRIFSKNAIREIAKRSQGCPRLINVICDHALLTGYVQGKKKIDVTIIKEVAKERQLTNVFEDNRVETDDEISTARDETLEALPVYEALANYRWIIPVIILGVLLIAIITGYLYYTKRDSDVPKPVVEASSDILADIDQTKIKAFGFGNHCPV